MFSPLASPSTLVRELRLLTVPSLLSFTPFPPHPRFVLQWGASVGLGVRPPSPLSGRARRACAPAQGVLPPPPLGQVPPPPPLLLHALRWERTLLGGCPLFGLAVRGPPPPSPACRVVVAHADQGVTISRPSGSGPPLLSLLYAVRWERTLLGGCPFVILLVRGTPTPLSRMPCAGSARCLGGAL